MLARPSWLLEGIEDKGHGVAVPRTCPPCRFSVGSASLLRRPWPSLPALLLTPFYVLVMSKVEDFSDLSSLIFLFVCFNTRELRPRESAYTRTLLLVLLLISCVTGNFE